MVQFFMGRIFENRLHHFIFFSFLLLFVRYRRRYAVSVAAASSVAVVISLPSSHLFTI